jgi:hypothetical protein
MTHIHHFPPRPDVMLQEKKWDNDEAVLNFKKQQPMYHQMLAINLPRESALDRLKRLIKLITQGAASGDTPSGYAFSGRPAGVIEIVMIESQLACWREAIEELGFKEVNRARNSNSARDIFVFHLNTGQD